MIRDGFIHKYEVIQATPGDLTGYERGNVLEMTKLLTGTDLGYNSRWTIKKLNGTAFIHPLNAPHVWSKRITTLPHVRTHFTPQRRK